MGNKVCSAGGRRHVFRSRGSRSSSEEWGLGRGILDSTRAQKNPFTTFSTCTDINTSTSDQWCINLEI